MSRDDKNDEEDERAGLETVVSGDSEDSPDSDAAGTFDPAAETVLADEDDRTQLVTGAGSLEPPASVETKVLGAGEETRVADAAEPADAVEGAEAAIAGAAGIAATRQLPGTEDKTSPPRVAEKSPPARSPSSNTSPVDLEEGLKSGMVLFGEYEIVNVLGVGGMGEVYRAKHRRLDEFRAIKVMHAELSKKQGASEFFYREAKALLAVRHPAVVHCHDLLSDDAGHVYLVMEMIEGIPLSKKMNEGPLSADDVAILGARVSHGLSAAHRKGVIHRDVSPDNIVLPNGRVQEAKIIDFGIAKILEQGEGTILDGFKGKLSYASPEQLGFFGGKLDGRSDFYSLGLVLAAAALGRPMPMGTTVMEAVDARRNFSALPDAIPVGLRSAIQPLLALDPKDRPKYVDRLFVVPGGIEGTDAGAFRTEGAMSSGAKAPGRSSRNGLWAAAGLAGVLAAAGGLYLSMQGADRSPLEVPAATNAVAPVLAQPSEPEPAPAVAPAEPELEPIVVEAPAPSPPKPTIRRPSTSERIQIIGLLNNAKLALGDDRLMSPAGDNAYDRYRKVLRMDPRNRQAKDGLRAVADRYIRLADGSLSVDDASQAKDYLAKARKSDSSHPELRATEARLR